MLNQIKDIKDLVNEDNINNVNSKSEYEINKLKDTIKIERFLFFITLIIVLNIFIFKYLDNWASIVSITIFELIILLIIGRIYEIKDIWNILKLISNIKKF